jgi:hypothetical protein
MIIRIRVILRKARVSRKEIRSRIKTNKKGTVPSPRWVIYKNTRSKNEEYQLLARKNNLWFPKVANKINAVQMTKAKGIRKNKLFLNTFCKLANLPVIKGFEFLKANIRIKLVTARNHSLV